MFVASKRHPTILELRCFRDAHSRLVLSVVALVKSRFAVRFAKELAVNSKLIYLFRSQPGIARRFLKRRVDRSDSYIGREADNTTPVAAAADGSSDSFPGLTIDGRSEVVNWEAAPLVQRRLLPGHC